MGEMLAVGQMIKSDSSSVRFKIEKFLGGGGQGEVYRADMNGKLVALKWYFPQNATHEQHEGLKKLIQMGAPSDRFLWPMEFLSQQDVSGFGYAMPLRPTNYKSIIDMMKGKIDPKFRELATAGFQLADSYLSLHAKGMCYRDISFGNVFFDPSSGEILICDNDNVSEDNQKQGGVLGTPRFMAPEIVRREKLPNGDTDRFSLAVLFFYMFVLHHPLEGAREASIKCLDLPAMIKLYGKEPLFIYAPDDPSNRPVPGYHDNAIDIWPLLPGFLRDLFTKAFTAGLLDPSGRVRESEWKSAMIRLRDSIFYCAACSKENFYEGDKKSESGAPTCWSCKQSVQPPVRIRIGNQIVMLNSNTLLYPHHIDKDKLYDFSKEAAGIVQNPNNPDIWGLKNLTSSNWSCTTLNGEVKNVDPGRSVTIALGTKINFGNAEGELQG